MYRIELINIDEAGIAEIADLTAVVWPKARHLNEAYLTWLYVDNPAGRVIGFNAYANNICVAHYAAVPLMAEVEGEQVRGLLSLNTATHPQHQGHGLFTKLANQTYDYAAQEGYAFVIGVANNNSTPGFVRKLDFTLVRPLQARAGFNPIAFNGTKQSPSFRRLWDGDTMRWRLRPPSSQYAVRRVSRGDRSLIFARSGYPILRILLAQTQNNEAQSTLDSLPQVSHSPWIWLGCDSGIDWRKTRSFEIPRVFRPSPLNLIFRSLGQYRLQVDPTNLTFQAIDFDAY